jgi:hypothetical protein
LSNGLIIILINILKEQRMADDMNDFNDIADDVANDMYFTYTQEEMEQGREEREK